MFLDLNLPILSVARAITALDFHGPRSHAYTRRVDPKTACTWCGRVPDGACLGLEMAAPWEEAFLDVSIWTMPRPGCALVLLGLCRRRW